MRTSAAGSLSAAVSAGTASQAPMSPRLSAASARWTGSLSPASVFISFWARSLGVSARAGDGARSASTASVTGSDRVTVFLPPS